MQAPASVHTTRYQGLQGTPGVEDVHGSPISHLFICYLLSFGGECCRVHGKVIMQDSIVTFRHVDPRDVTRALRLGDHHLHPLSHLASPLSFYKEKHRDTKFSAQVPPWGQDGRERQLILVAQIWPL